MPRKMKDSGIEWIGEIPEGWEVKKFKFLFSFNKGLTITKEDLRDKGIPCVNYGEIHSKYGFEVNPEKNELKCVDKEYLANSSDSLLKYGDFVFADTSEDLEGSGNFTYLNSHADTFAGYHTIIAKAKAKLNTRFIAYYFDSVGFRSQIRYKVSGIKVFSISQSILKEAQITFPSSAEQEKIINFLDPKCSAINKSIELLNSSIEKLQEYKKSVITEAVTKGLNLNVPMKDSGIEWIGEIPKHWKILRIKTLFREVNIRNTSDEKATLLSLFTAIGVKPRTEMEDKGNKAITVLDYKMVKKGDLIVNKLLAWMGAIGYSDYDGVTSPDYDVYRAFSNANVIQNYYHHYFRDTHFKDDCFKYGHGIMMMRWRTYPDEFRSIPILNPPHKEQQVIASYVANIAGAIGKLIMEKQALIDKLTEYKKSLIYEAVTGKVNLESNLDKT